MTVRAVGIDLVAVPQFAEQLAAAGSGFTEGTFTARELRAAAGPAGMAQHLAGRFAAKEAFVKAFSGARPGRSPEVGSMDWREVEVVADAWGRPGLVLHGELAAAVSRALGDVVLHLSITHEPQMAAAVVIIDGV